MIQVIDYYSTKFGELWEQSLFALVKEAVDGVLTHSQLPIEHIDAIFFANMLGGVLGNNLHAASKIAELVHTNNPVFRVESACASGGIAFHLAQQYIKSGAGKTVLVVGAEKMTDYSPEEVTDGLAAAASGAEQECGLTFPGLYAMLAHVYMHTYGYTEESLAYVAHKNHYHGSLNDKAQFQKQISVEQVLKSAYIAHPLKVLDCSPISDGAAALLVTSDETIIKKSKLKATVLASEVAMDSISLMGRKRLDELAATHIAAKKAFKAAKLQPSDIHVAELHDCFTIGELLAMEDIGFWKKGEAGAHIKELSTMYGSGGSLIVNTSGGLKAAGHPVAATGIKQIGELFLQLTVQAENRQVANASFGLAHNVGGSGGTAVVTILKNAL